MAIVDAKDLNKSFDEVDALSSIDLEVKKGEILGILGPNGAGKSTLVKVLTGQEEPDTGEAEVDGIDPTKNPVRARSGIGVLPEREDPPSFLTGNEYLEYVSDIRDTDIDVQHWTDRMNLNGKMEKLTKDLSKGERQKLMMIQSFFHDPDLVFIDEPLVNLDPVIQERSKDLFREVRDRGGSMILSTHVISLAEEICDRVIFLRDGEIREEVEDTENLRERFLDD
jgi:ABC-2 type transport system ATP-binding protein